jgi:hypothetical protein
VQKKSEEGKIGLLRAAGSTQLPGSVHRIGMTHVHEKNLASREAVRMKSNLHVGLAT